MLISCGRARPVRRMSMLSLNDSKASTWRASQLPMRGHRFEFKLYALDDNVKLVSGVWSMEWPVEGCRG